MNTIYQIVYMPDLQAATFTRCPDSCHSYDRISPASQERLAKTATNLAKAGWVTLLRPWGWGMWRNDWLSLVRHAVDVEMTVLDERGRHAEMAMERLAESEDDPGCPF